MEYIEIENVETGEVEVTKVVEIPTDIKSYKEFLATAMTKPMVAIG